MLQSARSQLRSAQKPRLILHEAQLHTMRTMIVTACSGLPSAWWCMVQAAQRGSCSCRNCLGCVLRCRPVHMSCDCHSSTLNCTALLGSQHALHLHSQGLAGRVCEMYNCRPCWFVCFCSLVCACGLCILDACVRLLYLIYMRIAARPVLDVQLHCCCGGCVHALIVAAAWEYVLQQILYHNWCAAVLVSFVTNIPPLP